MHPNTRICRTQLIAALLLVGLMPALLYWTKCTSQYGCLEMVYFGKNFAQRALPEVRALDPPALSPWGYDGQFYAQLALDPSLQRADLERALDNPPYRARRIGLPALAALLGWGNPSWTLQAYAGLNLLFWLILALLLTSRYQPDRPRHWLMYMAVLWSAGVLHSMDRSLTDLPAATLSVLAVCIGQRGGRWLMAISALFRDTAVLSFIAVSGWQPVANLRPWLRSMVILSLMTLPLILWTSWIYLRFGQVSTGQSRMFAWPGLALWGKVTASATQLFELTQMSIGLIIYETLELLAPLSLLVQSLYMLSRPMPRSPLWLFGIGFALLFWLLGSPVWAEQTAFSRALLPMTIAFNLLLVERRQAAYAWWFVLGNIGLIGMALKIPYSAFITLVGPG